MSNKIAVIEDEKNILDMYLMKFRSSGFNAMGAEDGEEGLKLIKDFKPDLILLDLRMPKLSGQELLKKLRSEEDNTPVIVLTNISQNEAHLDLRFLKVEKYIVKAYTTPSQVVEEVKNSLKRHGIYSES